MADNKGMGIGNIRSRISSLGGKFEIESWPDEGIIVTVELKFKMKIKYQFSAVIKLVRK